MSDVTKAMSHSNLMGGSIADRRVNCPRSYTLEQLVPKDKGSVYARQGTALHEMMARILADGVEAADLLPFDYTQEEDDGSTWTYTVTEDEWDELGAPALQTLDTFIDQMEDLTGSVFQMYIEQSCDYPGVEGARGTSDLIWRCGEWGGIWDWKFGRGYVSAYENSQLMFYLYAAIAKFPQFFGGVQWWGVAICQPKVSAKPSFWDLAEGDLGEFNRKVHAALGAMKLGVKAPIKAGDHCKFARCKAVCPLHAGAAVELGSMMAALEGAKTAELDLPSFLSNAMELAGMAERWSKTIAGLAQTSLENGATVPGWKLVAKKSAGKTWVEDEEIVEARLKERGLPDESIIKRSLVTPTQALTAAKKANVEIDPGLYEQKPSSGFTLTREDDPRPTARRTSEETIALGAALLANLKGVVGDTNNEN
jgi:hypothetical protein